jgi:hypothetical protein
LYEAVLGWAERRLAARGYPRPLLKRLALLLAGLLAGERASVGGVAGAARRLAPGAAKEESVARRLQRALRDARLDPQALLPDLYGAELPDLLAGQVAAHAANRGAGPAHHRRFRPLRLVLDETSVGGRAHVLVCGLAFGGLVLPLAARCWEQNAPLPEGEYWAQLGGLLWEVQGLLPPELRAHAVLLADRAYGVPRLLDLLAGLGWGWVVRVQGQARVRLPDGGERPIRELAPRPGAGWQGAAGEAEAAFKGAGWRPCRAGATWAVGEAEPWLLLADPDAAGDWAAEYGRRWAIERTFLAWKGHGWDLERCGLRDPQRLGRLLSGLALATLWRLAMALPLAAALLGDLAARAAARPPAPARAVQLPLPWAARPTPPRRRPWAAKFSLLSWGAKAARAVDLRTATPPLLWQLPDWDAPTWSALCRRAYHAA